MVVIPGRRHAEPRSLDERLQDAQLRLALAITRCKTLLVYFLTGGGAVLLAVVVAFLVAQLLNERDLGAWMTTAGQWCLARWSESDLVKVVTTITSLGATGAGGWKLRKRRSSGP